MMKSKRLRLTMVMMLVWALLAIYAIHKGADLNGLAAYYAAGAVPILGYIWGETQRPSSKQ